MGVPAIRINGLRVDYPAPEGGLLTVLDLPELSVQVGEMVTVAGRSGSGKTTLLNVLAGIVRPTAGTVQVLGHSLGDLPEEGCDRYRLLNVGYVHQEYNLLPGLTALENVLLPATFAPASRRRGAHVERARELLLHVGLGHRLHHRPAQLSGGEQQRVAIARALTLSPGLLLLDELTANLDTRTTYDVLALLRELWHSLGMTVIIASHDELVLRNMGRCVELTPPREGRETDVPTGNRLAKPPVKEPA